MTKKQTKTKTDKADAIALTQGPNDDRGEVLVQAMLGQNLRHGLVAAVFAGSMMSGTGEALGLLDCAKVVQQRAADAIGGNLAFAGAMLASQAITLDNMFTEFARRAALNMGDYPQATERYARLAMKAQANSRATLEALARLHQPHEQTVKHVHVNDGGQALVADHFHQHSGGRGNGKSVKQSDATDPAGTSPALLGPDAGGDGVPIPGSNREAAMQDARRHESGRAAR